jgi:peptide chain release factor 1
VPPTERKGRVHTSTVTVAVIDPDKKIDSIYSQRNDSDFKFEWYSGTGKGGQNRNKIQACSRITHIPTGIISTAQTRSRESSKTQAMASMIEKLDALELNAIQKESGNNKKEQVGSGMRGDKIRTYMDQHGIVKDHRTEKSASFNKIMSGNFDLLW